MKLLKLLTNFYALFLLFAPIAASVAVDEDIVNSIQTQVEDFLNDEITELVIQDEVVQVIEFFGITVTARFNGVVLKSDSFEANVKINEFGETTNASATVTAINAEVDIPEIIVEMTGFFRRSFKGSALVTFENVTFFMDILADVNVRRSTAEVSCINITKDMILEGYYVDADLPSIIEDQVIAVFDDIIQDELISASVIDTANSVIEDADLLCESED